VPGFKATKHRLTLWHGINASGDSKLELLLVCHAENPETIKV